MEQGYSVKSQGRDVICLWAQEQGGLWCSGTLPFMGEHVVVANALLISHSLPCPACSQAMGWPGPVLAWRSPSWQ